MQRPGGGALNYQNLIKMGLEKKNGKKVETQLAATLFQQFKSKVKKSKTSMAQVLRDLVQGYVKD